MQLCCVCELHKNIECSNNTDGGRRGSEHMLTLHTHTHTHTGDHSLLDKSTFKHKTKMKVGLFGSSTADSSHPLSSSNNDLTPRLVIIRRRLWLNMKPP